MRSYLAPTEAEVLNLFGVTHSQLDMKGVTMQSEENTSLQVYPMDMTGMPASRVGSIRRMNMSHRVRVAHDELFLRPSQQIAESQGETWKDYLCAQAAH